MSVTGAMVDLMRTVRTEQVERVDGESRDVVVKGAWIKCRLAPPSSRERREEAGTGYERDFNVIVSKKDQEGNELDIKPSDTIEISSTVYGSDKYELVGEIEAIRAKRRLIMYRAALKRRTHR